MAQLLFIVILHLKPLYRKLHNFHSSLVYLWPPSRLLPLSEHFTRSIQTNSFTPFSYLPLHLNSLFYCDWSNFLQIYHFMFLLHTIENCWKQSWKGIYKSWDNIIERISSRCSLMQFASFLHVFELYSYQQYITFKCLQVKEELIMMAIKKHCLKKNVETRGRRTWRMY